MGGALGKVIKISAGLSLVMVALGISRFKRLGIERELLTATVRALIQLAGIAAIIDLVFSTIGWSALLMAVMLGAAALTSQRRMTGIPSAFALAVVAIGGSTSVGLLLLFGTGAFPFEPRFLIPIAGMLIGNSMNATSIAGLRLREEIADKRMEVEARLALGVPVSRALNPYVRTAARTALIPLMDSTKNVGLVALPGAFVGMILGGSTPQKAATVQLVVLFMLLGAVSVAAFLTTLLAARRLIAPGERIAVNG